MIFCHASITTVDGYVTKREPHRRAHLERLMALRSGGVVVGGGPSPDGTTAEIFYRGPSEADVLRLVQEDPYNVGGVWASHRLAPFSHFLEPWELPPLVTDGSRVVTIVEGWLSDVDMAALVLVEARGAGRLAFGGFFPDGRSLTVMRSADPAEAVSWLAETGFWKEESLAAHPLLHVL